MKKTSQRSLLFRQNVGRTEGEWAHFLDGYGQTRFHFGWRLLLGGAEGAVMKGWCERAADIFAKHGEIAAKMKSAPGPLEFRSTDPIRRAPRHGRTRREGRTARSCFPSTRLLLHAGCADDASFFSWQVSHRTGQLSRARPHPKRCAFRHQREMSVKGENLDVERYCLLGNDQIGDAHLVDSVAQTSFLKCSDAFPVNL